MSEPQSELSDDEGLEGDEDDDQRGRHAEQAEREADREFIEADAEPQEDRAGSAKLD